MYMTEVELKPVPEVGKEYNAYDDGKIKLSRHFVVKIDKVVPYDEVDDSLKEKINKEIEQCDWLYAEKTDYVIFATAKPGGCCLDDGEYHFIRTKNGGWFDIGDFFSGRLDVDHKLTDEMVAYYREEWQDSTEAEKANLEKELLKLV